MIIMARISPAAAARHARAAGWSGRDVVVAVAVAMAESGLKADAVGGPNRNGSKDYGLWQINTVHNPTAQAWQDPATNARMAYRVWSDAGRSWRPWSTYKSGTYLLFMPTATAAAGVEASPLDDAAGAATGALGAAGDVAGAATGALGQVGDVVTALGQQETWLRAAKVAVGLALVVVGVSIAARPLTGAATKVARTVATKGAAA